MLQQKATLIYLWIKLYLLMLILLTSQVVIPSYIPIKNIFFIYGYCWMDGKPPKNFSVKNLSPSRLLLIPHSSPWHHSALKKINR